MIVVEVRQQAWIRELDNLQAMIEHEVKREIKELVGDNSPLACGIIKAVVYRLRTFQSLIESDRL